MLAAAASVRPISACDVGLSKPVGPIKVSSASYAASSLKGLVSIDMRIYPDQLFVSKTAVVLHLLHAFSGFPPPYLSVRSLKVQNMSQLERKQWLESTKAIGILEMPSGQFQMTDRIHLAI